MPTVTVVRCLGCAIPEAGDRHRCVRDRLLEPGGGHCQCPRRGCGPTYGN